MTDSKNHVAKKSHQTWSFLNKILYGLVGIDIVAYFLSKPLFTLVTLLIIIGIFGSFSWEKFECEKKLQKYKWFRKLAFVWRFKQLKSKSKSLNHTQLLLTKTLLNIHIEDQESEVKSFNDVRDHFGDMWAFMVPVKDTRESSLTVRGKKVLCISSYSYLDLCRDQRVQDAAIEAAKLYSTGNHGPRMLCGNIEILETLEKRIAKFYNREAALVLSSGYLACMSTIAGVARKNDLLLMDKLTHASLKAGAKLSGAKIVYFKHNDFKDAERIIKSQKYEKLIMVIEGVYSMDGDVGLLDKARAVCDKYAGTLILDEAHSLGAIGKTGRGTEEMYEFKHQADIICGTFTKSIGSVGGFITCSQKLRQFYTFYAPGAVFSAPLSAYHCGAADKSFEIIDMEPERVAKLQENAEYLRNKFTENKFNIGETISCVIPVIFRDTIQCLKMHRFLLEKGYFSATVMAPACPVTAPRFRICATSAMTKEQMDGIVDTFIQAREVIHETPELKELLEGF